MPKIHYFFFTFFALFFLLACNRKQSQSQSLPRSSNTIQVHSYILPDTLRNIVLRLESLSPSEANSYQLAQGAYFPEREIRPNGHFIRGFQYRPEDSTIRLDTLPSVSGFTWEFSTKRFILSKDSLLFICQVPNIGELVFIGTFDRYFADSDFPNGLNGNVFLLQRPNVTFSEFHKFIHVGPEIGE